MVVLAAGSGFGGGIAASRWFGGGGENQGSITIEPNSQMDTAEIIAKKALPWVVGISTKTVKAVPNPFDIFGFGGGSQNQIQQGVGTGFIVDTKGYILTNSHVVSDGKAQTIMVQLYDGREESGRVLWNDATLDLAIVKVDADGLTAADLGDSDEVDLGAYALAIGNPLGMEFQRSLSQGIISGMNRTINVGDQMGGNVTTMEGLLQTDASINGGNSGGPLINSRGQVIGINSAKAGSGEGMGFAIPINIAKPIVDEIKAKGEFTRAYLGIKGVSIKDLQGYYPNTDVKKELGTEAGIYVVEITPGGGAGAAGLKQGDVITKISGEDVSSMGGLTKQLIKYRPGDKVKISYLRDKQSREAEITLKADTQNMV